MSLNYCPRIHHGLTLNKITKQGFSYAACCWTSHKIEEKFDFNHPSLIELRQQNQKNILPESYCNRCLAQEQAGQHSMRQGYLDQHGQPTYDSTVLYLDINIDYTCNLACVTCGPNSSTTWRNELKIKGPDVRPNIEQFIDSLKDIDFTKLKEIRFWGGEPFLTRTHSTILEHISSQADVSNIQLMYNTNGTQRIDNKTKSLLEKFKLVKISFSIDDVESRFEYLRWPAQWNDVSQTLLWWRDNLPHNSMLSLTVTVSMLNVLTLNSVYDWCKENFNQSIFGDPIEIYAHQAFGKYGLELMPTNMIERFKNIQNYCQPWIQRLDTLGRNVDNLPQTLIELRKLNQRRGIDFQSVMPEVAELIGYSTAEPMPEDNL